MKNKLGTISLIISAISLLLWYFAYFTKLLPYLSVLFVGGYLWIVNSVYVPIMIILSIFGIIVAIRALFLKEEFKGYPILAIIIFISIILFIL